MATIDGFVHGSPEEATTQSTRVLPRRPRYFRVKRVLDVVGATLLLAPTALVMIPAAIGIKLTSRGPIFYCQSRLGRNQRPFRMYKLRTMVVDAEAASGPVWCAKKDPRVTAIGWLLRATHVDEFPQLINVLLGDMSLIGPRPERPEIAEELEWHIPFYNERHAVAPGIAGLAQCKLPPDSDLEGVRRKVLHDLYYIREAGMALDLRIAVSTALIVPREVLGLFRRRFGLPASSRVEDYSSELLSTLEPDVLPATRAANDAPLQFEALTGS